MPISINGSGTITGISAGGLPDASIITADIADGAVTQAKRSEQLTLGTAQNSTSGTSIDFTGIPSWVKRVTVIFQGVSTSGTSNLQIQLGAGSVTTTGYSSVSSATGGGTQITPTAVVTTGMVVRNETGASGVLNGHFNFTLISGNTWVHSHSMADTGTARIGVGGGTVTLSGTLDRIRITTVNGTDTFDAGSINIMYE